MAQVIDVSSFLRLGIFRLRRIRAVFDDAKYRLSEELTNVGSQSIGAARICVRLIFKCIVQQSGDRLVARAVVLQDQGGNADEVRDIGMSVPFRVWLACSLVANESAFSKSA
ncbi:MAG TPA: hypothetical protein VFE23_21720 [Usitatibacter sp.]|jgi:hypothetical protein|nr:hypothetical protein [Usitatibacter sp.]